MADPFEVRLRFTSLLTHLTASTTSSAKTASYALKHRDMDEDLHSCIIESLDNPATSMNARANIMYFLEHFCDVAGKGGSEGHAPYIEFVKRDLTKIVAGVIGGRGGANTKVVRKVVEDLKTKHVLGEEHVLSVEEVVRRRETEKEREDVEMRDAKEKEKDKERERRHEKQKGAQKDAASGRSNGHHRVDKRAIEQRIEEDRERNKRLRESVWAVEGDDDDELNKLWEETSDLNDDDYLISKEEAEERAQFARYHKSLLQEAVR